MPQFARVGDFCPNEACADSGKPQGEHQKKIVKYGKTKAGRQRYLCRTCRSTFTETKGAIFRRRTPEDEITEPLALLAEGDRISSLARVKGHKEDTIRAWLRDAAEHPEAIKEELLARYRIKRTQLDSLWAYVGNKGGKKLPRDRRKRAILACHPDRYGHPPACSPWRGQNGDGGQSAGL